MFFPRDVPRIVVYDGVECVCHEEKYYHFDLNYLLRGRRSTISHFVRQAAHLVGEDQT